MPVEIDKRRGSIGEDSILENKNLEIGTRRDAGIGAGLILWRY